jgi:hypothetical protein
MQFRVTALYGVSLKGIRHKQLIQVFGTYARIFF